MTRSLLDARSPTSAGADDIAVPATLREIDHPACGRLIPNVPATVREIIAFGLTLISPDDAESAR